jgi:hypothetical protein
MRDTGKVPGRNGSFYTVSVRSKCSCSLSVHFVCSCGPCRDQPSHQGTARVTGCKAAPHAAHLAA